MRNMLGSNVSNSMAKFFLMICVLCGVFLMPDIVSANADSASKEGFDVTVLGDHQFGSNGIGIWLSGKVRLGLSNTLGKNFSGVGIVDANLSPEDLKEAKDIHKQLCHASGEAPSSDLPLDLLNVYSISCIRDGKMVDRQGRLSDLPRAFAFRVGSFYDKILERYINEGGAIVKVNVIGADVQRGNHKFLIAIQFVNSGQYPVTMQTPDQWDKRKADRLDVSGKRIDAEGEWAASLAGLPVINKSELSINTVSLPLGESGTFVTIPPGGSVTFKFLTIPNEKVPKGTYTFNVLAVTTIDTEGDIPNLSRVDFGSDLAKSARIKFDEDFPLTPEEWKSYEAQHRAKMSSFPVKPGEAFPEAGHYRLVSNSGQLSRFVFTFRKDAIAPQWDNVQDEQGKELYGMLRWQWEADNALHDFCRVGDPCPREGRWISAESDALGNKLNKVNPRDLRRFVAGELMPDFQGGGRYHYTWYWLGA